ncbi:hypothetical protein ACFL6I_07940 [candidate division KSB1 bacterium]
MSEKQQEQRISERGERISKLLSAENDISFIKGNQLDEAALEEVAAKFDELKDEFDYEHFCIYFEDEQGNLVPFMGLKRDENGDTVDENLDGQPDIVQFNGMGSENATINDVPCGKPSSGVIVPVGPLGPVGGPTEICDNGADDDGDGFVDCADADCEGSSCGVGMVCSGGFCVAPTEICGNGADDDDDGWVDCDDTDCIGWKDTGDLLDATVIRSLLETTDGIYAGTFPNGDVFYFDGTTWVNTGDLADATQVWSLLEADGIIYAGTVPNGDVFKCNPATTDHCKNDGSWSNTGNLAGAIRVHSLLQTTSGTIYAGTYPNGDVFTYNTLTDSWINTGNLEVTAAPVSVAQHALSLLQTTSGTIYAGTYPNGDVYTYNTLTDSWTNTGDLVGAMYAHSLIQVSGSIYAGTFTPPSPNVFVSEDGQTWANTAELLVPPYPPSGIYPLLQADGIIYAGTSSAGGGGGLGVGHIFKCNPATTDHCKNEGSWSDTGALPVGDPDVHSLLEVDGAIYVGTAPNGDVFKLVCMS